MGTLRDSLAQPEKPANEQPLCGPSSPKEQSSVQTDASERHDQDEDEDEDKHEDEDENGDQDEDEDEGKYNWHVMIGRRVQSETAGTIAASAAKKPHYEG